MSRKFTHIDRYEVIKILGHGGMGTVYLCHDPDMQRNVAIKLFDVKRKKVDITAMRRRFMREVITTAALQHPCIPPVYEFKQHASGKLYYVMKPIEGRSLQEILRDSRDDRRHVRQNFNLLRLVEILCDVSQAIHYAHSKGFIHRDLKPANIFVGNYGEVYVIDWGLTKIVTNPQSSIPTQPVATAPAPVDHTLPVIQADLDAPTMDLESVSDQPFDSIPDAFDEKELMTLPGNIMGTLPYMPPEQAEGDIKAVGKQSDIYAIGVMLYEILTFELPFKASTVKELLKQKIEREIPPPELRAPNREIPPELSAIAAQAMHPSPEERFKSAREIHDALESWVEGRSEFRPIARATISSSKLTPVPKTSRKLWDIDGDAVATLSAPAAKEEQYLLFTNEYIGDIRFSVNFIAYPVDDESQSISQIGAIIHASEPVQWRGLLEGYVVTLGASGNTRAVLSKNGVDLVSDEYIMLEPGKRYKVTVERVENKVHVVLNRQLILTYHDMDPLSGTRVGFVHKGPHVVFSDPKVMLRGSPTRIPAMEVPEALMAEKCYDAAMKRFLAISQSHRNRFEGAWARYMAGIACYRKSNSRTEATKIWRPLKKTPYAAFEKLGRATIDIENEQHLRAARILEPVVLSDDPVPQLDKIADVVFREAQQHLRRRGKGERRWKIADKWSRLALLLGRKCGNKQPLTPSILWQWILLALTEYPQHFSECTRFISKHFGEGRGEFSESFTTFDPLMTILKRSAGMSDHSFLVDKVMRLILNHDDNLGNLETLVRFYLNSGHLHVAKTISEHVIEICQNRRYRIPPAPITFISTLSWIKEEPEATQLIKEMISNSSDWAPADGWLLLGLDSWKRNDRDKALKYWSSVARDKDAISYNRHLVALGLLNELPPDPIGADVPNRSDHRLLYCLFLGLRDYAEWQRTGDSNVRDSASRLLKTVLKLMRPSYDIYSATDIFARIPLETMGIDIEPFTTPESLSDEEITWLHRLTSAATTEKPARAGKSRWETTHK